MQSAPEKCSHCHATRAGSSGALAKFSAQTAPRGLFAANATLAAAQPVASAEACAALCLARSPAAGHGSARCASFNLVPTAQNGLSCELNKYGPWYALAEGRKATYYLRNVARNDEKLQQAVPWLVSPPNADVSLAAGSLFRRTFDTNILYVLNYTVADMLYWFRTRNGLSNPPGHNRGWDGGKGAPDYPYGLKGSIAGIYMMGAAGTIRWDRALEHSGSKEVKARLDAVISGIEQCRQRDGFIMAYPQNQTAYTEHPDYVLAWVTYGLLEAHMAGNTKALRLLRCQMDWFNYCEYLPLFLPPDGGPNSTNTRRATTTARCRRRSSSSWGTRST